MKKGILWMVLSGLMAISLVVVSCGQAEVEETKGPGIVVKTGEQEQNRGRKWGRRKSSSKKKRWTPRNPDTAER